MTGPRATTVNIELSIIISFWPIYYCFFTDQAFVGTTSGYNKRLETYDHWSAIKDKNKIPPYRATNENWQPCNNKGNCV